MIDSLWPLVADPARLSRITVVTRAKDGASSHAVADMLDSGARQAASDAGCVVVACASDVGAATVQDKRERRVDKEVEHVTDRLDADDKPIIEMIRMSETVVDTIDVPALARDYWIASVDSGAASQPGTTATPSAVSTLAAPVSSASDDAIREALSKITADATLPAIAKALVTLKESIGPAHG